MYIEKIPEFENMTDNTKTAKINRLAYVDRAAGNKPKRVIDGIFERAHTTADEVVRGK